ncbi:MAG: ABC transporter permease subunit [Chloroflexi bacterium]|nr:ABC transporter permease subunit [Chloroflexota bacterium]
MDWLTPEIWKLLGPGLVFTLLITAVTSILALLIGITVGTMRLSERPFWHHTAIIYIELFRNVPALVLIIFFAFAVPNLFPQELRQPLFFKNLLATWGQQLTGLSLPYYLIAAIIAISLNSSAYLGELFRAGVGTIPREYGDAARSLGATQTAVFRQILLPQGIKAAFPAITTRLIHTMKNSALASFVAVPEFFHATQAVITRTFLATKFLLLAAALYLILSLSYAALLRQIEQRIFY